MNFSQKYASDKPDKHLQRAMKENQKGHERELMQ